MRDRLSAARVTLAAAISVGSAGALASCGSSTAARAPEPVSVALDFTPNPNHAAIFLAQREGFDRRRGVRLEIRRPGSGPDSLKLLLTGSVEIGVLDIDDLALARERGADVVGIAALVQQPLGALIAQPDIHRPRDLVGRRVGVSGLPSDPAFLRAILFRDGASLSRVRQVTIGFNAVADMAAGDIAAVPAFWSVEGVALRLRGIPVKVFRIDRYGAPEYPEVVLAARPQTLLRRRHAILEALAAIAQGTRAVLADPATATQVVAAKTGSGDLRLIRAQTDALAPALLPPLTLNRRAIVRWASFDARTGLLPHRLDVAHAFDFATARAALRLR